MEILKFINSKKEEIKKEWGDNQRDEWTNGYYNCLLDIEKELSKPDTDVTPSALKSN